MATITMNEYKVKTKRNRMGLWLFLISDSFVFAGLLISRFTLLGNTRPELNQNLGLFVTGVLLLSSFYMNRAEIEMTAGNVQAFLKNAGVTIMLGAAFLAGVVFVEWPQAAEHLSLAEPAGAIFYIMTGFHAFHVLTGLLYLFIVYRNAQRGVYTKDRHWGVEACAIYWHFIDVAWIFFYPALYLMGTIAG